MFRKLRKFDVTKIKCHENFHAQKLSDHTFLVEVSLFPFIVSLISLQERCKPPLLCPSYCLVAVIRSYFSNTGRCTLQVFTNWCAMITRIREIQIKYKNLYVVWFILIFNLNSKGI